MPRGAENLKCDLLRRGVFLCKSEIEFAFLDRNPEWWTIGFVFLCRELVLGVY